MCVGCDCCEHCNLQIHIHFNSRICAECDYPRRPKTDAGARFQFSHMCRMRPRPTVCSGQNFVFQFSHMCRMRRSCTVFLSLIATISILAYVQNATWAGAGPKLPGRHFNSRICAECDMGGDMDMSPEENFNSRICAECDRPLLRRRRHPLFQFSHMCRMRRLAGRAFKTVNVFQFSHMCRMRRTALFHFSH